MAKIKKSKTLEHIQMLQKSVIEENQMELLTEKLKKLDKDIDFKEELESKSKFDEWWVMNKLELVLLRLQRDLLLGKDIK